MQIICPLLLGQSLSVRDQDVANPQSMSFNNLYKSLLLIHKALAWFTPREVPAGRLRAVRGCLKGKEVFAGGCRRLVTKLPLRCYRLPLCNLQKLLVFIFYLQIFFFKQLFFILPLPLTCQLSFLYEKAWFLVRWPLLGQSLVLCGLMQPYSFTSLLQEVFPVKWRALTAPTR